MHQPYYRDCSNNELILPWVRLHGIKDYLNMVEILKDYPSLHQTFNLTPVLLEQLEELISDNCASDRFFNLSKIDAGALSDEQKEFILLNFFMANWEHMIRPYPRYYDLLLKRGKYISRAQLQRIRLYFKTQDYRDLQVWFNLAWFDPSYKKKDPLLNDLVNKGSNFTEEDKRLVLEKQIEVLKSIIPAYKRYKDTGQIEITVSPYYHPILPLLCDTDSAREALPNISLPNKRFKFPQDARWHIEEAAKYCERLFGKRPDGMWPSEGSVSEGMLPLVIESGFKWLATDEEILLRSLGKSRSPSILYTPYLLKREGDNLNIIFRDRYLSDLIGFVYSNWSADLAVEDFIKRLKTIKKDTSSQDSPSLVSIILDGENAWEYYHNNGRDFLTSLYGALSNQPDFKIVTVNEFLSLYPPKTEITHLSAGSWIGGNFSTWIGHKEKNLSWDALYSARQDLAKAGKEKPVIEEAFRFIYIAEGSDYNWWYGDEHSSSNDEEFDALYRNHLSCVYKEMGKEVPAYLKKPIKSAVLAPTIEPARFITPTIDGKDTNYYEWLNAGHFDADKYGGTMHRSQSFIKHLYYGFDASRLYLRLDIDISEDMEDAKDLKLIINILNVSHTIEIPMYRGVKRAEVFKQTPDGKCIKVREFTFVAFDKIFEVGIERSDIAFKENEEALLQIVLERHGLEIERVPDRGPIRLIIPPSDYESRVWYV